MGDPLHGHRIAMPPTGDPYQGRRTVITRGHHILEAGAGYTLTAHDLDYLDVLIHLATWAHTELTRREGRLHG